MGKFQNNKNNTVNYDIFCEVTWRTERARLDKQRFQWRHSFSEIFILIITVIGLG